MKCYQISVNLKNGGALVYRLKSDLNQKDFMREYLDIVDKSVFIACADFEHPNNITALRTSEIIGIGCMEQGQVPEKRPRQNLKEVNIIGRERGTGQLDS